MRVTLIALQDVPVKEIGAALRSQGIKTSEYSIGDEIRPDAVEASLIVLLFEQHGAAEPTDWVFRALAPRQDLTVCCPAQSSQNRELLMSLGVSRFLTPRSWTSFDVADRIAAEVFVEHGITPSNLGGLYGASKVMRDLYEEISTISTLSDPILILGETGTGKDVVAREIHNCSGRGGKFIALNCGEFSPEIIESELFGHAKGAFTGAGALRKGLLLESGEGTVFLDEIGELPIYLQSKLLRVIEERKVRPVGANNWLDINARFLLATNRKIDEAIASGNFRQDLFERISAFVVQLPPLRDRMADLPLLFELFLKEYCKEYGKEISNSDEGRDLLFQQEWVGNVRELRALARNLAAHPSVVDGRSYISPIRFSEIASHRKSVRISSNAVEFDPATESLETFLNRAEHRYLTTLLEITENNRDRAIKLSGIGRSTFYEKMKYYFGR